MSEDATRLPPDQQDILEEYIRLFQTIRADIAELNQIIEERLPDTYPPA
jgi:hypothetical protein